jgi:hypothetical protein
MSKGKEVRGLKSESSKRIHIKEEPEERVNFDLRKPVFSFYHMQYGKDNCLSRCDQINKTSVSDKLMGLSQLTWAKIACEPKTGLGYEKIPQKQFKVPLPRSVTPEVSIQVFRHSRSGRIAGFRKFDVYHIILVGDHLYSH